MQALPSTAGKPPVAYGSTQRRVKGRGMEDAQGPCQEGTTISEGGRQKEKVRGSA